jgi:dephospho-CoA kinase
MAAGKSAVAAMFRDRDIWVWDADRTVARLYGRRRRGTRALAALVPAAVRGGRVFRPALREAIAGDPGLLGRIEAAIHPLLAESRARFVARARRAGAAIAAFELPLLYETGADAWLDRILLVTVSAPERDRRLALRPGLAPAFRDRILARQLGPRKGGREPDFTIDTSGDLADTRREVDRIITRLTADVQDARNRS